MAGLRTPAFWLTHSMRGTPRPWEFFKVENLMVNAYDIIGTPWRLNRVSSKGIHRELHFDGNVMMDSGGYLLMRKRNAAINLSEIVDLYESSDPDFCVALDYPLRPRTCLARERSWQKLNLRNISRMIELRNTANPTMIPVIHGSTTESAEWFISRLERVNRFDFIGIGSLVPYIFNSKGGRRLKDVISVISYVRKRLPEARLHSFGVGSVITMHLMFRLGIDSIDSSSWRTKAAYGAIQLPAVGDRYITSRKRGSTKRELSRDENRTLDNCKCPGCSKGGIDNLRRSFKARALHNAWVFQEEIMTSRRLMRRGGYAEYADEILRKSRYRCALESNSFFS